MPSTSHIHLLDTVALVRDLPELGLVAGEVGAVVDVLSEDAFEVEFCDKSGHTYGLHTLRAHQVVALHTVQSLEVRINHTNPNRATVIAIYINLRARMPSSEAFKHAANASDITIRSRRLRLSAYPKTPPLPLGEGRGEGLGIGSK